MPLHLRQTQRAVPMTLRVAHAPASHLGMVARHPSELERASCCRPRAACAAGRLQARRDAARMTATMLLRWVAMAAAAAYA